MLKFNPENSAAMIDLMDKCKGSSHMYFGSNAKKEEVTLSIFYDKIICVTYQENGWTRTNIYYRNGDQEETYDK